MGELRVQSTAKFSELKSPVPVRVGREKLECGAQVNARARKHSLRKLVVRHGRAQQAEIKVPIAVVVFQRIHRLFHFLVGLEEFAPVEQFDAEAKMLLNLAHGLSSTIPWERASHSL